ncbi:aromatic ring-hydroxylating dioxygenase subunit alpha [Salipaludibacillus sp. LMS25]|uniref:aromatic ring-hydroxylating oxygenase subunit alpha n=1 Tax=Salipaludibacillus sp. LMS25 TaxID=2924031 RepID=UPI0020D19123|nr:aromatic ring-hydroxylating dioxygenase subunit alpha [Salipaludibacillus sp. LMS25]UTR15866.1 aromatic ring-hydroxylating dioxygenase subunit alpha [Salipaludibacillus sp. LMS25]
MNISTKMKNQLLSQSPPTDLFNSRHFENVKLPCEEAKTLPSWCYTSDKWYNKEVEKIILPSWHFVGHISELENIGDYKTIDFQKYKLLIIKGKDNVIRAFHNSCRHRGSKLLKEHGNCKSIRCCYHSWNYAIDGTLTSAPYMENIKKEENGLLNIHCQVAQGLIFINLNDNPIPLEEYLGDFIENIKPYSLEQMTCVKTKEYTLDSNWKLYIEVDMETYHTPHIHTHSIGKQLVEDVIGSGDWVSVYHPSERTVALAPEDRTKGFPHISGLYGRAAKGIFFTVIFPGFFIVTAQDSMWWIHKIPEGPEKTKVKIGYCFPKETTNRSDFKEKAELYFRRWDQVIDEDNWITEFQQEAIRSSIPGHYSHLESVVHKLDNWIIERVID